MKRITAFALLLSGLSILLSLNIYASDQTATIIFNNTTKVPFNIFNYRAFGGKFLSQPVTVPANGGTATVKILLPSGHSDASVEIVPSNQSENCDPWNFIGYCSKYEYWNANDPTFPHPYDSETSNTLQNMSFSYPNNGIVVTVTLLDVTLVKSHKGNFPH